VNIYAKIAHNFATNKQLSLLLVITTLIGGVFAFLITPKQYNPEITLPAFRIITEYPGASAKEVERQVTNVIENKLYEIPGLDETFSQSYNGGLSIVTLMFKIGANEEEAKTKVYEKIYSNLDLSPLGIERPIIKQINPENVAILNLAISSNEYDSEGLRELALDLKEELKTIKNVTNIEIKGGKTKKLVIEMSPEQMSSLNVSIQDIENAIKGNNLNLPGGRIENDSEYIPVDIEGSLDSESLKKIQIGGTTDNPIRLEDVAQVFEGFETDNNYVKFSSKKQDSNLEKTTGAEGATDRTNDQNNQKIPPPTIIHFQNTVYLAVSKQKGSNGVKVSNDLKEKLNLLKKTLVPEDIQISIVRDEGLTAQNAINGLTSNLLTSILIVTIILILFLKLRSALVVALAIPLTLSLVLLSGFLLGKNINRITLFALILSLGLLVDSATVVIENIYRNLSAYYANLKKHEEIESHEAFDPDLLEPHDSRTREEVIAESVGEVGGGLLSSTITSVIVFAPMSFITGMMGAYMGPIAFFVPAALIASLLVAYTLSPYLASQFLTAKSFKNQKIKDKEKGLYARSIANIIGSQTKRLILLFITFTLILITFSFPVLEFIHFRMLPTADKEQFYLYIDAPEHYSLQETETVASKAEDFILKHPEVVSIQSYIGTSIILDFNGLFKGADSRQNANQATLKINLTTPKERKEKSEEIVQKLRPQLIEHFAQDPQLKFKLIEDPPGPPVLSTLLARIKGPDPEISERIALDLLSMYNNTDQVVDIDSSLSSGISRKLISIDHKKLTHSGLNAAQVATSIHTALKGKEISIAHLNTQENNNILLKYKADARDQIKDLDLIQIRNNQGELIALKSIATINDTGTIPTIWHDDREETVYVNAELSGRPVVYAVKDLIFKLREYKLPNQNGQLTHWNLFGFTYSDSESGQEYRIEWGGEFEMTLENFRDLGLAMMVAFFLIYVVLVAQFKSFSSAILIMTSIGLAFGGVLPGFAILDKLGVPFTATSMIGLIALGGIVVNNSIILLEFIEQLQNEKGYDLHEAILIATETRFRPIVLTSITTILGSLTIASDPVWSGLAWAIIFGLTLSTILTLVIFPVLYYQVKK